MSMEREDRYAIVKFIAVAALFVLVGGGAGILTARLLAPPMILPTGASEKKVAEAPKGAVAEVGDPEPLPEGKTPAKGLLWVRRAGTANEARKAQWQLASEHGVEQFAVTVELSRADAPTPEALAELDAYGKAFPEASFQLALKLVPEAGSVENAGALAVFSEAWIAQCGANFQRLAAGLAGTTLRLSGMILLGNTENGWGWELGEAEAPADIEAAFQAWLQNRYASDEALREHWGSAEAALNTAKLQSIRAAATEEALSGQVLAPIPVRDARLFLSSHLSDLVAGLAGQLQGAFNQSVPVIAACGFPLEKTGLDDGQLNLSLLMESTLDGFLAPMTEVDRGVGGSGGPALPLHSMGYNDKQWYLVEDTRTGIQFNAETQQFERLKGIRAEDIFNVQRRNVAFAALAFGTGIWTDVQGEGAYIDEAQWTSFENLDRAVRIISPPVDLAVSEVPAEAVVSEEGARVEPAPEGPDLMVLYDEGSMAALGLSDVQRRQLITGPRDAASQAGLAVEHCLLQDFVENRTTEAPIYLFVNALVLSESQRKEIHARMAREQASAIWHYAPGLVKETASIDQIGEIVRMKVLEEEEQRTAGSVYTLGGSAWLLKGQKIGEAVPWPRLFYVDDEACDGICQYAASGKVSVAIRTMDEGWTSVYIAEPDLNVALLREVLQILDTPSYIAPISPEKNISFQKRGPYMALHARNAGEYILDLGAIFSIEDLLDPAVGWPQTNSLVLKLKAGETRLLKLSAL
ncbi:MAG: hypothetical protein HYV27_03725 [Candidatus Hydrogenedentes bacterium]|nr:hypothetical protein [Candidatus Hydrogenedentota bacterium]